MRVEELLEELQTRNQEDEVWGRLDFTDGTVWLIPEIESDDQLVSLVIGTRGPLPHQIPPRLD